MTVHRYYDLDAWKLANEFKRRVFEILRRSPEARRDRKFRTQLVEAARGPAKHIAEGFMRESPAVLIQFLDYAVGSLAEARDHLQDGIELGSFSADICREAMSLSRRSIGASLALKRSQERCLEEQKRRRRAAGPKRG